MHSGNKVTFSGLNLTEAMRHSRASPGQRKRSDQIYIHQKEDREEEEMKEEETENEEEEDEEEEEREKNQDKPEVKKIKQEELEVRKEISQSLNKTNAMFVKVGFIIM